MDDDLGKILLEGGGGGQMRESYELAMYFMARHTSIDCFEKRGKRGYLFMIGDELAYPKAKRREIAKVIGGEPPRTCRSPPSSASCGGCTTCTSSSPRAPTTPEAAS